MKLEEKNGLLVFPKLKPGQTAELRHAIRTVVKPEKTAGVVYKVSWRGPDVIDVLPHGEHLLLVQRDLEKKPYLPKPRTSRPSPPRTSGPPSRRSKPPLQAERDAARGIAHGLRTDLSRNSPVLGLWA